MFFQQPECSDVGSDLFSEPPVSTRHKKMIPFRPSPNWNVPLLHPHTHTHSFYFSVLCNAVMPEAKLKRL